MRAVSPWLIPRNDQVEEALAAASDDNNLVPFEQLLAALQQPLVEDAALAALCPTGAGPACRRVSDLLRHLSLEGWQ